MRDTLNTQAPLAKSSIRSKLARVIVADFGLAVISRDVKARSGQGSPANNLVSESDEPSRAKHFHAGEMRALPRNTDKTEDAKGLGGI
jgi:hypothetical protein